MLRKDVGIRCHHQAVRMLDSCAKAKKNFNELFYFLLSPINIFHKIVGDFCLPRLESQPPPHLNILPPSMSTIAFLEVFEDSRNLRISFSLATQLGVLPKPMSV